MMRTLDTANIFVTQVSDVLSVARELLLEIDGRLIPPDEIRKIERVASLLSITEHDCDSFVKEIEAGPAFVRSEAA